MDQNLNFDLGGTGPLPAGRIKIIGVGRAGIHCLDRLVISGMEGISLTAVHTREQVLESSIVGGKLLIGARSLRGVGASGDPELGEMAALEDVVPLRRLVEDADLVLLVSGLGGGTGTGALPVLADLARAAKVTTHVLVTMPFEFEGRRRGEQARRALAVLRERCDAVFALEHDRLEEFFGSFGGLRGTFEAMTDIQLQVFLGVWRMLVNGRTGGPPSLRLHEAFAREGQLLFGHGKSESGRDRVKECLDTLFASPMLAHSILLRQAGRFVLVVQGSQDLPLMDAKKIEEAVRQRLGPSATLEVFVSRTEGNSPQTEVSLFCFCPAGRPNITPLQVVRAEPQAVEEERPEPDPQAARKITPLMEAPAAREPELLAVNGHKGRFEKTDPTIFNGEDLDVPTFLRRPSARSR